MSGPANTGASAPMMGSSRLAAEVSSGVQEPAKSLQNVCNGPHASAHDSAPDPWELEWTGTVRDQLTRTVREQPRPHLGLLPDDFTVWRFRRVNGPPIPVLLTGDTLAEHFVYRLYEREAGQLGYVGIAMRWRERVNAHAFEKAWWPHINFIAVHGVETRELAVALETVLIARYRPLFNIALPSAQSYTSALDSVIEAGIDRYLEDRRTEEEAA